MLIGGVSSTLDAQVTGVAFTNKGGTPGNYFIYETKDNSKKLSEPIDVTSKTKLTVWINPTGLAAGQKEATVYLKFNDTGNYLGFANSYTIAGLDTATAWTWARGFELAADKSWNMPNTVNTSKSIVYASLDKDFPTAALRTDTAISYSYPVFTVEYMAKTAQYAGSLRISNITGSNPELYDNNLDNGEMWRELENTEYHRLGIDTVVFYPFNNAELGVITYGDRIIVYGPQTYYLTIPGLKDPETPGTILRPVTVPVVEDAVISREPGIHQVPSTQNFTFTIKPTGSNAGKIPVVTTGRTTVPDSEGVTYEELADGTWLVTILRVQTPINLSISFTVGNTDIESSSSVWASGGQLYVNASTNGNASVYSITGALVKTITLSAGETASESLSTGFYVVTVNGKAYKVTIK